MVGEAPKVAKTTRSSIKYDAQEQLGFAVPAVAASKVILMRGGALVGCGGGNCPFFLYNIFIGPFFEVCKKLRLNNIEKIIR